VNRKEDFIKIYTSHIKRAGASELLDWLEESDFFTAPASTRFHGNYEGGLCEHSVNVWEELIRLLKSYPEVRVTAETAAIVTLLHDLCKVDCYKQELRNQKVGGVWVQRPVYVFQEDFCYGGHGSKSVYLAQKYIALTEQEAVAINCHMGSWDRNPGDYSLGPAFEKHPLAWLVHVADESATYIRESKV
jgi:hypothetical protein